MSGIIVNPGFGIWPDTSFGGLTGCSNFGNKQSIHNAYSREFWCPQCYNKGKYTIIDWIISKEEEERRNETNSSLKADERVCYLNHIIDVKVDRKEIMEVIKKVG